MLKASLDPSEFDWIKAAVSDWGFVKSVVPEGLAAYCAVHHPDEVPGSLCSELLRIICTVAARHTNTPEACFFCLWQGSGWLRKQPRITFRPLGAPETSAEEEEDVDELGPAFREALVNAARVELPGRPYYLLEGPLTAALEFGWHFTATCWSPESPHLFWPKDHAWCVATEVDLPYTLVCGTGHLIAGLTSHPNLNVSIVQSAGSLAAIRRPPKPTSDQE